MVIIAVYFRDHLEVYFDGLVKWLVSDDETTAPARLLRTRTDEHIGEICIEMSPVPVLIAPDDAATNENSGRQDSTLSFATVENSSLQYGTDPVDGVPSEYHLEVAGDVDAATRLLAVGTQYFDIATGVVGDVRPTTRR
jgi:hypothetical protein